MKQIAIDMGRVILKQPDGKFCVFSSIIDDFIIEGASPRDIIDLFVSEKIHEITVEVNQTCDDLDNGVSRPRLKITYEEAIELKETNMSDEDWLYQAKFIIEHESKQGKRTAQMSRRMIEKVRVWLMENGFRIHYQMKDLPYKVSW